ncbi:uncharacterized protein OCT59_019840 [Rhizophagus irregularis]|nr:hypothetical protein OCT59_019840 [Rhizophagus irregularis]
MIIANLGHIEIWGTTCLCHGLRIVSYIKEAIPKRFGEQTTSDVDLSSSLIDQRNNDDVKASEEKEMDAFLVEVNKKSIKLERRREKKVQDKMIAKDSSSVTSDLTHCEEDLSMTSAELVTLSEQVVKESISVRKKPTVKEPSADIASEIIFGRQTDRS